MACKGILIENVCVGTFQARHKKKKPSKLLSAQHYESVVLAAENSDTGPVVIELQVEDMSALALIDTGAGVSLISSDIMSKLEGKQIFPTNKVIRNASGNVMLHSGKSKLTLKIGGRKYTHDFIICEDKALPSQLIIGLDFMRRFEYQTIKIVY